MSALHCVPPCSTRANVLSAEEYATVLWWITENEALLSPSLVTGHRHNSQGRHAFSYYGNPPWREWMTERMRGLLPEIAAELGMPTPEGGSYEVELVAYPDQSFIGPHRDTGTGQWRHNEDRVISIVYYLFREPKGFSGGALRLWALAPDESGNRAFHDLAPIQNGLAAFPSWALHEVLPVKVPSHDFKDARFAINFWVRREHE